MKAPSPIDHGTGVGTAPPADTPDPVIAASGLPRQLASPCLPWFTMLILAMADTLALVISWGASVAVASMVAPDTDPLAYWRAWPLLGLFLVVYTAVGLYPGVGCSPPEELKRTTLATTWVYLLVGAYAFLLRAGDQYFRGVVVGAWLSSLAFVPVGRAVARGLWARRQWWGHSVLILGAGKTGAMVVRTLCRFPGLGLNPVAILDDDPAKWGVLEGVPVVGGLDQTASMGYRHGIRYVIMAMPGVERQRLLQLIEQYGRRFPHLIVVPDLFGISSLWVLGRDLGGVLGLEIRQRLLMPIPRLVKRAMDWGLTLIGAMVALPLILLIAALIKLESPGPALYGSPRVGQGGRRFRAWKFRSMVPDADKVLQRFLDCHPELREEYERTLKLRNDPRITRVGRFLRCTSLDELPQLWNVLAGEMSLVGPRPLLLEEPERYGDAIDLYCQVLPGLTGLWQVSGRNDCSYQERIELNNYYVRNWSPWLDVYILARTVVVVVGRKGAY